MKGDGFAIRAICEKCNAVELVAKFGLENGNWRLKKKGKMVKVRRR